MRILVAAVVVVAFWNGFAQAERKGSPHVHSANPSTSWSDSFDTGVLDGNRWTIATWGAPRGGYFSSGNVDLSQGMLCLKLEQYRLSDGSVVSYGGQIETNATYGYGTYQWTMRAGSTAATPFAIGMAVSGGVSAGFNWINDSQTEIDIEFAGDLPNFVDLTSWTSVSSNTDTNLRVPFDASQAFHTYKFVWQPERIDYFIDGVLIATHTTNVSSTPAAIMMNHWGIDNPTWGGTVTIGVTRYFYVSNFTFIPQ
jgi:endo-1,3-1,4-beta-glycanase ExoK